MLPVLATTCLVSEGNKMEMVMRSLVMVRRR
jgi:hypothetical protein